MIKSYHKYWKIIAPTATKQDIVLLCALKAFFAKETNEVTREEIFSNLIAKSFTPITNVNKLRNGMREFQSLEEAMEIAWSYAINCQAWKAGIFNLPFNEMIENIFDNSYEKFGEFQGFIAKQRKTNVEKFRKRYYSYIFVDQEGVDPIYQLVQASHVAMVIGQKMDKSLDANNIYFQICKRPVGLTDMAHLIWILEDDGFKVEEFYEPDVDRTIAIGIHPVRSDKRKKLRQYELLNF